MTRLCRLTSIALLVGSTAFASASEIDYRTNILDPLPPATTTSYPTFVITSAPFDFSYTGCITNELPNGLQADGCFAGVNRSGSDWIGMQLTFPNVPILANQTVSCAPAPTDNIYSSTNCTRNQDGSGDTLTFDNGVIRNGDFFFITEVGVLPAELFPQGHATVTTSETPEPAPLILLGTGLSLTALLAWRTRSKPALSGLRF